MKIATVREEIIDHSAVGVPDAAALNAMLSVPTPAPATNCAEARKAIDTYIQERDWPMGRRLAYLVSAQAHMGACTKCTEYHQERYRHTYSGLDRFVRCKRPNSAAYRAPALMD